MAQSTSSQDMQFFAQLVRCGSLTAAARELQVTTAAVSKRLASLEARLGVDLLHRTTRRLALTDHGRHYLDHSRRILDEIESLESGLQAARAQPAGLVRVNATLGFGRMHIGPAIAGFSRKYPRVDVADSIRLESPAKAVVQAGEGASLLVVGRRRHRTGLAPHLGPVAQAAVHHGRCPVAVVPHD